MKLSIFIFFVCFFIRVSSSFGDNLPPALVFKMETPYDKDISIKVENEPVFKSDTVLTPLTLTTQRPVLVSIGAQTKKIKIEKIYKNKDIPIDVVFADKTVRYTLKTLPDVFPEFTVKNPSGQGGFVLISLHGLKLTDPSFSFILDMNGNVVYYRGHPEIKRSMFHLKKVVLPNGKIRYITHVQDGFGLDDSYVIGYHLIMDENFNEIDRVELLKTEQHEALKADEHDILMIDDGHYIVTGQDVVEKTLEDGQKSLVTHTVIQEQKDGIVLLDWDAKNYPQLEANCYEKCPADNLKNADYIHPNSLFIDPKDNNILVSAASGFYVMKIHRMTGDILWILGGKINQFKWPTEDRFIRQHDVQLLSDGRLMLFDNHYTTLSQKDLDKHKIQYKPMNARIMIFDWNEDEKIIKSIETIPLNFSANYMGSVQKLNNNRWFIGCGSSNTCTARMIDKNGKVLWNMKAKQPYKMFRTYFYDSLK